MLQKAFFMKLLKKNILFNNERVIMANEIQQQFYYAKYDSNRDYSRQGISDSDPIGLINLQDEAVISIFDTAKNELVSTNTNISNNSNWVSQFRDFTRFIKCTYNKYAMKFAGIKYDISTQQSADNADAEFEKLATEYKTKAQDEINNEIQIAKEKAKDEEANAPSSEEVQILRDEIQSKGFSKYALKHIQISDDKEISFISLNGKYIADGQEVDEKTFLEKYEQAITANKNGKFEKPYWEQFDEHSVKDNHDGTFTVDYGVYGYKDVFYYDGRTKEAIKSDGTRKWDMQNKTTEIDGDKLSENDRLGELFFDKEHDYPWDDNRLGDAEIKDSSNNIVYTKKNNKFYDASGNEVNYNEVEKYIKRNKGIKITCQGVAGGFGI